MDTNVMDKNATIIEYIKKLISKNNESLGKMRKTTYVEGYQDAIDNIKDIIEMVESIQAS